MKTFLNDVAAAAAGVALFVLGCGLAALGLATLAVLTMVALVAAGLTLLASPFVALVQPEGDAPRDTADPA